MPFCIVKGHLLMCKGACFAMQKGTFYKPLCNLLIPWWLQRRFLTIISWFANNNTLQFVRVFLKPEHIPDRSLKHIRHSLSPDPSPKGEGSNKRDTPLCLRRYRTVFEGFGGLVFKLESKRVACSKLRIYELQIGESRALNYEFTNSQIVNCRL